MINRRWFEHLWPWSRFYKLRAEHEQTRVALLGIVHEFDPYYFQRMWGEWTMESPRMNCVITGISAPTGEEPR
jgi:hypothetical protein